MQTDDVMAVEIASGPMLGTVRPPGSKSLTNRGLLLAALADGESVLRGALLDADDAQRMMTALRTLGVGIEVDGDVVRVRGVSGRFPSGGELFLNNAGTATRFLTAAACLASEAVTIDGNERMRERPIGELVDLLRRLGIDVEERGQEGFVPIRVSPSGVEGGDLQVATTLSSQFISALYMVGLFLEGELTIELVGDITSPSYLEMTLDLMRQLGAGDRIVMEEGLRRVTVKGGGLRGFELDVEPDASGATYLWAMGALVGGSRVFVPGLDSGSLQGDARFVELLSGTGANVEEVDGGTRVSAGGGIRAIEADLSLMPDAAMTIAAVCAFADGVSELRGLRTLRVKETDRIEAMRVELGKVGVGVEVFEHASADGEGRDEGIRITPMAGVEGEPVVFETYDDHRMAMSLALVGLRRPGVSIADPACVGKTYAGYWEDLARLRG
ncbi:MAG: 3-phosphoshikimate 1-carboxyvinyltransferase [Planctomycetota bacterium]